jgi:hypothetical protein
MKTIILLHLFGIFLFCEIIFAQPYPCGMPSPIIRYDVPSAPNYSNVELRIYNQTLYYGRETPGDIRVLVIPDGAFFDTGKYTPKSASIVSHKIAGAEIIIPVQVNENTASYRSGNWDRSSGNINESDFSYGYGKYKFEFYRRTGGDIWEFANYVYIDFRDTVPHFTPPHALGSMADMRLDYFTKDTITYQFDARHDSDNINFKFKFWHIDLVNKELKVWDKYGTCIPPWIPDRGAFYPDPTDNGAYLKWPIYANQYNGNIGHENPGDLGMNLVINHDITTHNTLNGATSIITPNKLEADGISIDTKRMVLIK